MKVWRTIKIAPTYEISDKGEVRNKITNKILKQKIDRYGYKCIGLYYKKKKLYYTIHRLLATEFVPNPDNKPQVNHIDGNKLNNSISNLEWSTAKENVIHALYNDLYKNALGVIVTDINTGKTTKYLSLKMFAKTLHITRNVVLPYIRLSSKYPFCNRYIIALENESYLQNRVNTKIFGDTCYVYDYLTKEWKQYDSISIAVYWTGLRGVCSRKGATVLYSNKNIGFIVSKKKFDVYDTLDETKVKVNREQYYAVPYNPMSKHGYLVRDYLSKNVYKFETINGVVNFINEMVPSKDKVTKDAVVSVLTKVSKFGKKLLVRGFGIKYGNDTSRWEPKQESYVLANRARSSSRYVYRVYFKSREKEIVYGTSALWQRFNAIHLDYTNKANLKILNDILAPQNIRVELINNVLY